MTVESAPGGQDSTNEGGLDRRSFLIAGAGLGAVGALGVPTGTAGAFAARRREPVSMAMHLHSSFSEGVASMDAHLRQAERLGVDVVWWTDHDYRMTSHGYLTSIRFDGPSDPSTAWNFEWQEMTSGPLATGDHTFVRSPVNRDESGSKMRVTAAAKQESSWATYALQAVAENSVYSTSYSDTTLELDVYPQQLGDDARIVVEIVSSYRPETAGRPAGQYRIQYRLGDPIGKHTARGGLLGIVGRAAPPSGEWFRTRIRPRSDHQDLWPDTVASDASLFRLRLGVMTRRGATARVVFDRLRFVRSRNGSSDARALQAEAIRAYRRRYPTVTQFAAAEITLVRHLNAFGGSGTLPTYPQEEAQRDNTIAAQRAMVAQLRGQGATVAINHPMMGVASIDALASRLIRTNGMGAQLIEVGCDMDPTRLADAFDAAARNGVLLTATGTTDDHTGRDWLGGRRWLTRVWSATRHEGDLCRNLEAGRAWFYDPLHWDGALNLTVAGMHMGGVRFTSRRVLTASVRATELPKAATVQLVIGKCDFAGAGARAPVNKVRELARGQFTSGVWHGEVSRGEGCFIRVVVRQASGDVIGFSNPVWVLPPHRRNDLRVPALRR